MKRPNRAHMSSLRVSRWWIWVPFLFLLAGGCKPREPRELRCVPSAIFEALEPKQEAGAAPFSIERLGPRVESDVVEDTLDHIILTDGKNGSVTWMFMSHFSIVIDIAYSPTEGLARRVDLPEEVYPMKRFIDGKSERVRFGYRSKVCLQLGKDGPYVYCKGGKYSEDERFLVADMTCKPSEK